MTPNVSENRNSRASGELRSVWKKADNSLNENEYLLSELKESNKALGPLEIASDSLHAENKDLEEELSCG